MVRRETNLLSGERMPARWPALRSAMLDGAIGVAGMLAATAPLEKIAARIGAAERVDADDLLAEFVRGEADEHHPGEVDREPPRGPAPTIEQIKIYATVLALALDPDGEQPGDEPARRRGVTLGPLRDGLRAIKGWLTPDVAAQLEIIFDALNNPKGDGPPVPAGVRFAPAEDDVTTAGRPRRGSRRRRLRRCRA